MPADKNNPFLKVKRKKRKKRIYVKPDVKLYCPSAMIRYDGGTCGYSTMWVCKMCLACCLTDVAATQHSLACKKSIKESWKNIPPKEVPMSYSCHVCNRIFSRKVTLKKHLVTHDQISSENEIIESDSEKIVQKKRRGRKKTKAVDPDFVAEIIKKIPESTNSDDNLNTSIPGASKVSY
ncbi:Zinc finger C2H2-type [Cinara cedri]|uniref:Zinc finger C2H2-type n=1 Tax=Cinara cedri TaxID=506608 RepID=A0A5E4MHB2_9HEMI|nr:Zinc finger C2H2-type [Cinara cedri]